MLQSNYKFCKEEFLPFNVQVTYREALKELLGKIVDTATRDYIHVGDRREETRPIHVPLEYIDDARDKLSRVDSLGEHEAQKELSKFILHVLNETSGRWKQHHKITAYFETALNICKRHYVSEAVVEWLYRENLRQTTPPVLWDDYTGRMLEEAMRTQLALASLMLQANREHAKRQKQAQQPTMA